MSDSLVERISDWSSLALVAFGVMAWWFSRSDADRKKTALDRYKEEARIQMKGLEVALEAERNRGLELVKAVSPRSLRTTESARNALRQFSGVTVEIKHLADMECANTAAQIQSLVTEAGWKSASPEPVPQSVTILEDVVVYVKMFGDVTPEDTRVRNAAGALVKELSIGGIKTTLGNGGTGMPSGVVSVMVSKRHSLAAAIERTEWLDKLKTETGIDVEEQIRRGEELSSSADPGALLKQWSVMDKPKSKPK